MPSPSPVKEKEKGKIILRDSFLRDYEIMLKFYCIFLKNIILIN